MISRKLSLHVNKILYNIVWFPSMYTFERVISELLQSNEIDIKAYFSCYQAPISKSIKILTSRISNSEFLSLAGQYWWTLNKQQYTENDDVYYIKRDDDTVGLGKHRLHTWGFFYMQEVAASLPVQMLDIQPWEIVLDMCAAPWGKSVQIHDKGWFVVSNEISWSRVISLQHNLNRTWCVGSCVSSLQGGNRWNIAHEIFDHVLVDAPCSWEGTGFKSDDWLKRWREDNIHKIARLQKELLLSAIKACKVWWTIVYSTCTINPWENELVIADALTKYWEYISIANVEINNKSPWIQSREGNRILSDSDVNKVARFWPHIQQTGGFFIAKFQKTHTFPLHVLKKNQDNKQESNLDISANLQEKISKFLLDEYGIVIDKEKFLFVSSPKQIYLTDIRYTKIHNTFPIAKVWVPILKRDKTDLRPLHGLWNCLGSIATKNVIALHEKDLQRYSDGFDLPFDEYETDYQWYSGYVLLTQEKRWLSVGKITNNTIKNKYSKS